MTTREWEALVPVPTLAIGETWDFRGPDVYLRVHQTQMHSQRWEAFSLAGKKWVQQIWDREWPLRDDPLRVAVREAIAADERGADFAVQSAVQIDMHGGEQ